MQSFVTKACNFFQIYTDENKYITQKSHSWFQKGYMKDLFVHTGHTM